MIVADSAAWTGRTPDQYWSVIWVTRHFGIQYGWDFQRDVFGIRVAIGRVKNPMPGCSRYRQDRFFGFFPRHYRR